MILVALDTDGEVLGYAKSGPHRARDAYASTVETSIYVADGSRGTGVGGALYDILLERLDSLPLRLAVAGATQPNEASTRLHLSRGFTAVGTFSGIGTKHGRAWDVAWYQRPLAPPPLVQELRALVSRGGDRNEAIATIHAQLGDEGGELRMVDPQTGEPLGSFGAGSPADRLMLEWCAEMIAPLWLG
jgi:GNAT superfamily N-acetyltransferase